MCLACVACKAKSCVSATLVTLGGQVDAKNADAESECMVNLGGLPNNVRPLHLAIRFH